MVGERLTWEEIKQKYPHQNVGLVDVEYLDDDNVTVRSAIVKYTDKTMDCNKMVELAIKGEIILTRTYPYSNLMGGYQC